MRAKLIAETGRDEMISVTKDLAKSGQTNGFFLYINGCSQWGRDLTTIQDLRFVTFDEAVLDKVNAEWGGTNITLPARLFNGVDQDMVAVGWRHHYIYGGADVPDELVTAVLKATLAVCAALKLACAVTAAARTGRRSASLFCLRPTATSWT